MTELTFILLKIQSDCTIALNFYANYCCFSLSLKAVTEPKTIFFCSLATKLSSIIACRSLQEHKSGNRSPEIQYS